MKLKTLSVAYFLILIAFLLNNYAKYNLDKGTLLSDMLYIVGIVFTVGGYFIILLNSNTAIPVLIMTFVAIISSLSKPTQPDYGICTTLCCLIIVVTYLEHIFQTRIDTRT